MMSKYIQCLQLFLAFLIIFHSFALVCIGFYRVWLCLFIFIILYVNVFSAGQCTINRFSNKYMYIMTLLYIIWIIVIYSFYKGSHAFTAVTTSSQKNIQKVVILDFPLSHIIYIHKDLSYTLTRKINFLSSIRYSI